MLVVIALFIDGGFRGNESVERQLCRHDAFVFSGELVECAMCEYCSTFGRRMPWVFLLRGISLRQGTQIGGWLL